MKCLDFIGFPFHCVTKDGRVYSLKSGRFLNLHKNQKGYLVINLWDGEKLVHNAVHRLVALAYLDSSKDGQEVNHKDGDKTNNLWTNLEWCTKQENIQHSVNTGLRDSQKEYTEEQIHIVCRYLEQGFRNKDIVEMTGVHPSKVSMVKNGLAYQHISQEYKIRSVKKANRISLDKIEDVCRRLSSGKSPREIARNLNIGYQTVRYIKRREMHTDISKNYDW